MSAPLLKSALVEEPPAAPSAAERRDTERPRLLVVFLISAVMLMLEILFPMELLFLPERGGNATIIAIVMLGLGVGGLAYYAVHGRAEAGRWAGRSVFCLPFFILLGFFVTAIVPGRAAAALALAVPFGLISFYLSRSFVGLPADRVYFVNLLGSAAGAGVVFLFHSRLGEENGIFSAALLAGTAGCLAGEGRLRRRWWGVAAPAFFLGLNLFTLRLDLINLIPSFRVRGEQASDALSFAFRAVRAPGARRVGVSHNLVSRVDAVFVPAYDLARRYFPGGLEAVSDPGLRQELAASLAGPVKLYYMDRVWSQVVPPGAGFAEQPPYLLLDRPRVLVIGPGGGVDIARAAWHNARRITAVEINPGVIKLMRGPLAAFSGKVYEKADTVCMDGRTFVRLSREHYDLIHLAFADLYVPLRHSDIFLENYLYTLEAFRDYYHRLSPEGMIAVYKWVRSGSWNKDLFRIAATARAMLEAEGVADPAAHLFFAGMEGAPDQYLGCFLIRKRPFTAEETAALAAAVKPPVVIYHAPGLPLKPNPFRDILLAPRLRDFLARLPYDISPATDDQPLFYLFDRSLAHHRAYFAFFLVVISLTIILPAGIVVLRERLFREPRFYTATLLFSALGVGYMFLQTALLQKFNLYLGSPTLSLALVITAFLLFGGAGAEISGRIPFRLHPAVLPLIAGLALFYALRLDSLLAALLRPSLAGRAGITLLLLAPLCLALGLPFPQALERNKQFFGEKRAALFFLP